MLHALFCSVISLCLCFCPYVLLSLPISTDTFCLGSAAATAWTWETTCSTAGAAGSAEVPARSDPVFTAAAPAAAWRAEETENRCCHPDHAGGGGVGLMKNIGSWLLSCVCMWHSAFRQICVPFYLEEMCLWSAATQPCRSDLNHCFIAILKPHGFFVQLDGQPLHPYADSHMGSRSLPNSSSEMCLRSQEEQMEARTNMRKHSSMSRLTRDSLDGDGVVFYGSPRRIVDSCVQTDDEDGEER